MPWKSKIPATLKRTRAEFSALVRKTALQIETDAKLRAPVDTGFLRASIQTEVVDELTSRVFVGASYGIYVEYGTTKSRPQPYLTPAIEKARSTMETGFKLIIK